MVIRHTDTYADYKQNSHIVDQRATRLHKEKSQQIQKAMHITALHRRRTQRISNSHQNTADRQTRHRQHQGFTQFL